ncbi:MAG: ABC transporter permease [Candidatus Tectomicrobia bacterium]|uniref:ABC transporter permease n=1 Tax=Tectimicrobiota bacterium TaxID=2528274 RepID=A0A938B433_UNCTE|nr:ABC transporter permease [Candidatus Tectomicrobia bacterium]
MGTLPRYLLQRLCAALLTLLGMSCIIFIMVRLLPGDPARVIAGLLASEDDVSAVRRQLGLDRAWYVQYGSFLAHALRGDLGLSARTSEPVVREIMTRLPATLKLAIISTVLATGLGILSGVLAARHLYSGFDYVVSILTLFGVSMPVYWLGLLLIIVFAVQLNWLPAAGADEPGSVILPALTLASFSVALVARMTRATMLEVLGQDFVRTARAKGLSEYRVVYRHALRNALIPVITAVGLQFGALLGGAVLTETVFGWPGLGQLLVESIFARDYPMVQGIVLVFSALFIVTNLLVDLSYVCIDPRIHYN